MTIRVYLRDLEHGQTDICLKNTFQVINTFQLCMERKNYKIQTNCITTFVGNRVINKIRKLIYAVLVQSNLFKKNLTLKYCYQCKI